MMSYYDYGYGMDYGWIVMTLFFVAIIWIIIWLLNQTKHLEHNSGDISHKDILKKRYAKGEITKKEYLEMRNELSKD